MTFRFRPTARSATPECPVCHSDRTSPFVRCTPYDYWQCAGCRALFVDPAQRPDRDAEHAYYRLHRNAVDDPGYRRFLARLADPLLERLPARRHGLDFGCGPAPALARMLEQAGHTVTVYDPLFADDATALQRQYDFITCSEVAEHLHQPDRTFAQLFALLRPGGLLAVMTGFPPDATAFERWHYRRDPTHVVFYRPDTFRWLAERHAAECDIPCPNVALLHKRVR